MSTLSANLFLASISVYLVDVFNMIDVMLLLACCVIAAIIFVNAFMFFLRRVRRAPKAAMNNSKAVVITGCDSGFGEMTAIHLSSLGYHVVAACLTKDGCDRMGSLVAKAVLCDITKEADVKHLTAETEKLCKAKTYTMWALINNAGIAKGGPLDWIGLDTYYKVMEVNFFGHVRVTKAFLPLLKQQKDSRIVNLSSVAGFYCSANLSAYGASKHAMEGFMKSVREELKPWSIYVSNINPGFMRYDQCTSWPPMSSSSIIITINLFICANCV